jgi:DNA-binding MarR family transcriptional regulator
MTREHSGVAARSGVREDAGPAAGPGFDTAGVRAEASARCEEASGRLFVSMARLTRRLRQTDTAPYGPSLISALGTIVSDGPMRLGDLAATEGVRAPTMTRIVDSMVTEGIAERVPDPADGRACLVRATPAGTEIITGTRTTRSRQLVARMARLDPDQLDALYAALPALEALCDAE